MQECQKVMSNVNANQNLKEVEILRLNQLSDELKQLEEQKRQIGEEIANNPSKTMVGQESYENFSNFFGNIGLSIRYSNNKALVDKMYRMVFSNFIVKGKKVLDYQYNPDFEKYIKMGSCPSKSGW